MEAFEVNEDNDFELEHAKYDDFSTIGSFENLFLYRLIFI